MCAIFASCSFFYGVFSEEAGGGINWDGVNHPKIVFGGLTDTVRIILNGIVRCK